MCYCFKKNNNVQDQKKLKILSLFYVRFASVDRKFIQKYILGYKLSTKS